MIPSPINFESWLIENKDRLKPPVNNFCVHRGDDFFIMAVGGPNRRSDYHINPTEEWFYQLKGDMLLKIVDVEDSEDKFKDIWIKEGGMLLLPANIPHNPVRFENTIGLVIERTRKEDHLDKLCWYCRNCKKMIHEESFFISDIQVQLKQAIERYSTDDKLHICPSCKFDNTSE